MIKKAEGVTVKYTEVVSGDEHGGHYSVLKAVEGMEYLRRLFPDARADTMNFVLFSTSGIHGTYQTIEDEEKEPGCGVTFLVINPRLVRTIYGNAFPETEDDFDFLKKLRESSKQVVTNEVG